MNHLLKDFKHTRKAIFAAPLMIFLCMFSEKAISEETWEIVLRQQLNDEKQCQLNFMTNIRKFELAGNQIIEGRIHCVDGRQYDFTRPKVHQKFEIRVCMPTVC